VSALEAHGRYPLCIWPSHCLIGSRGHAVHPALFEALVNWENEYKVVDYVEKGSNVYTEHYSAIKADVSDPSDPSTQLNIRLVSALASADRVAVAGEAGSHCVANTVRDLADSFGDDRLLSKIVLLQDAVSPVGGFEDYQNRFVSEMTARGMTLSSTDQFEV
jgi:nicotinamidase-related amidase